MDNSWVVPILSLIVVYAFVSGLLGIFWVMTRYAYRRARRYWQLPPKAWAVLAAGLIMQVICVLIFTGAIYVSFLPQSFKPLYDVLLDLGYAGVGLSSLVLLLWLALVILAQRHTSLLEVLFGRDLKKMKWAIIFTAAFPFLIVLNIGGLYHSWLIGILVAVPFTLYILCAASLIAHSSEEPPASATQS